MPINNEKSEDISILWTTNSKFGSSNQILQKILPITPNNDSKKKITTKP